MSNLLPTIPYDSRRLSGAEMDAASRSFFDLLNDRRSVREFSDEPVPRELIERAILTASTAPSGAHRQPWKFVVVGDPEIKSRVRTAAEAEERANYVDGRMPQEWRDAVAPLGTDEHKPYLEIAPWLVVVFEEMYGLNEDGSKRKNYYVKESVGIACGFFIAALHNMGLATLTHTPSPMRFLSEVLGRPKNEKPYILFPVGYPVARTEVPDLRRKSLDEISIWDPRPEEAG